MTVECLRSKFGYCRLGNICKNIHYSEICEKTCCAGTNCEKRHPVPCFYFNRFRRCKFGEFCAYRHNNTKEQGLQEELKILRTEFNDLKKEIHENKKKEKSFSCDNCDQVYTTEKKLRQHKIKKHEVDLDNTVEESEWSEIVQSVKNLESKVTDLEEKAETFDNKTKYTSVEVTDIFEKVDLLTCVVKEHDEIIIQLEENSKPKDDDKKSSEFTGMKEKIEAIYQILDLFINQKKELYSYNFDKKAYEHHYKDLFSKLKGEGPR